MFLTAVLQAHTDTLPRTGSSSRADALSGAETLIRAETASAPACGAREAAVPMPPQLEKALTLPVAERLQSLPSAHRSRWV